MSYTEFTNTFELNFIKLWSPVHTARMLQGCTSVDVRHKIIKLNTTKYRIIYSLLWFIAATCAFVYIELFYYKAYSKEITFYVAYSGMMLMHYIVYLVNLIHTTFYENRTQIFRSYLIMQKIDRTFGLERCKSLEALQFYFNALTLMILTSTYSIGMIAYMCDVMEQPVIASALPLAASSAHVTALQCAHSVVFLNLRLRFLNKIIRFNMGSHIMVDSKRYFKNSGLFEYIGRQWFARDLLMTPNFYNNPMDINKIVVCLKDILKAFRIVREEGSFVMFLTVCTLVLCTFLTIEMVFLGSRNKLLSYTASTVFLLSLLFFFLSMLFTASVNAWFTHEAKNTKMLCIRIMGDVYQERTYAAAKEMFQALEYGETDFNVYGIFDMGRTFPLKLFSMIIGEALVLIQLSM